MHRDDREHAKARDLYVHDEVGIMFEMVNRNKHCLNISDCNIGFVLLLDIFIGFLMSNFLFYLIIKQSIIKRVSTTSEFSKHC